jgi:hypothetical protein
MNFLGYCLAATAGISPSVFVPTISLIDAAISPADATASFLFANDGSYALTADFGGDTGDWMLRGAVADYEIRLTKNSGTDPGSGNLATWESLSSSRFWSWTRSGVGETTFTGLLEIRRASTGLVLDSGSVSITISVDA